MIRLAFVLLFPLSVFGQVIKPAELKTYTTWDYYRKEIPSFAAMFVSGMADGLNQTLEFHYSDFQRVFPKANPQYWNPSISWTNKYKYHDQAAGPAYPGSTSTLVGLTDAYHMTRSVEHAFIVMAIYFKISMGESKKIWQYILESLSYLAFNRLGMVLVYNGMQIK